MTLGGGPVVVGTGLVAALNYGKLPPALEVLREDFGLSLVQASWMVSLFTMAAVLFGIAGGAITDRFGARRVMVCGLCTLAVGSIWGATAGSAAQLFASRLVESLGFLFSVLPAPALLRAHLPASSLRLWLGIWGGYMPAGMSLALVITPWLIALGGWQLAWWASATAALAWAFVVWRKIGSESPVATHAPQAATLPTTSTHRPPSFIESARVTISSRGPWLIALCFMAYAGQFVGIFSFLPMIYTEAGLDPATGALLTALGVLVNIIGSVTAGILLHRGHAVHRLIVFTGVVMALCAWVAFGTDSAFAVRYGAILMFSAVGGLIPGALFATAPFFAPHPSAVSSTVGMLQQGSGLGHVLLPMMMAAVAQQRGDWSGTWIVTGCAALLTIVLALAIGRHDRQLIRHR